MELSNRLQAVADLVSSNSRVADIGTDHGYIPIYLVEQKKCPFALAMDVNEGPLLRAKEHISGHGLDAYIKVRLSDGVRALEEGEADSIVIAGMGGGLVMKILEEGKEVLKTVREYILQPQSEISKVRQYLNEQQYRVIAEDMVLEEGKFYPMMKVIKGEDRPYTVEELRYGRVLLRDRHPVLKLYLEKEIKTKTNILESLKNEIHHDGGKKLHIEKRQEELKEEIQCAKRALAFYRG